MPKLVKACVVLVILLNLTGCQEPPKPAAKPTPLVETTISAPPPIASTPAVIETHQPPAPTPPVKVPETNNIPAKTWLSWTAWCQTHGCGQPGLIRTASGPHFELKQSNNSLSIATGSRIASWNGMTLGLGFEPRLNNGQPYLHSLDIEKNVQPLMECCSPLPPKGNRLVVIDPGHGGENGGAQSFLYKGLEKNYTLDWAVRLESLLEAKGWKVLLTRSNDLDISLSNRVAFAEQAHADLFISLHFNSIPPALAHTDHGGLETYCLTPAGMPSNLTRDFEDNTSLTFPNNAFDTDNLQYAVRIHKALLDYTKRRDRGVRRARFMSVLRDQHRPAVLIEGGYLSDAEEARLIASPNYRQKLAEGVAAALSD